MTNFFKEYIVTLKDKTDLPQFYLDMEQETDLEFIPCRSVECIDKREISRNTHYLLSSAEAIALRKDPRISAVSLKDDTVKTNLHSTQTAVWSRSDGISVSQKNWGLYRINKPTNTSQWGSESGDAAGNITETVSLDVTGRNVDIVIVDDIVYPDHSEYSDRFVQYDWFGNHDLVVRGSGSTISQVSRSSGSATISTAAAHRLTVGAKVTVTCTSNSSFNETNAIVTNVSSTTSFSYANAGTDVGTTSATGSWVGVYQYDRYSGENNHGTHVTAVVGGITQGWARESNLYNLRHDTKGEFAGSYTPSEYIIDYVRQFHETKSINPETGRKNPTLVNCSWGIGKPVTNQISVVPGKTNNRFSAISYRGTLVTPNSLGNTPVDTGYSGVCAPTALLTSITNLINGGNRITTTGSLTGQGTCTSITKDMKGRSGLTDLGLPTESSVDGFDEYDDAYWYLEPPFDITFANGIYGPGPSATALNINISSNSSILFGGTGTEAYTTFVGTSGPAIRKMHISAGDRSCQKVFAGVEGTAPNRTYRIRWEGHESPAGGIPDEPTMVWEATFYEATSNQIDLHVDTNSAYRGEFTNQQLTDYGIILNGYDAPYRDSAIDADIEDAIAEGIIFVSSAGNGSFKIDVPDGEDYDNYFVDLGAEYSYHKGPSPAASHADMICVGALDSTSEENKFALSNTGPRVDLYAPGSNVVSAVFDDSGFPVGANASVVNNGELSFTLPVGTTVARNGSTGIVTVTCPSAHNIEDGSLGSVKITTTGYVDASGSMVTITALDSTRFTYQSSGSELTSGSVEGNVKLGYLYQKYNGSSVAAAQVTGMLALLLEKYPDLTQAEAKKFILQWGRDGVMLDSLGTYTDSVSLQGGANKVAYYYKDRPDTGSVYPNAKTWLRPSSGMVYPRPKLNKS
jgi:hypothetical protein